MGNDSWQLDRVADAYDVARSMDSGFALFPSFDMGIIPCREERDGDMLRDFVNAYHNHSNQLAFKGNPLASTFGGQGCYFGQPTVNEGWRRVLKRGLPAVHFLASFFMDPGIYGSMDSADGAFSVSLISLSVGGAGTDSRCSGTRHGPWGTTTSRTNTTLSSGSYSKGGRIWLQFPLGSLR